jgi:hypothetical protein
MPSGTGNITIADQSTIFTTITADNAFTSSDDLTLQPTSECVDAGGSVLGFDEDLDGTPIDMGAFGGQYPVFSQSISAMIPEQP